MLVSVFTVTLTDSQTYVRLPQLPDYHLSVSPPSSHFGGGASKSAYLEMHVGDVYTFHIGHANGLVTRTVNSQRDCINQNFA